MNVQKKLDQLEADISELETIKTEAERRQIFQPDGRYTDGGFAASDNRETTSGGPLSLRGPGENKSYKSMFGDLSSDGWKSFPGFFAAAQSGKYHPNLRTISEGVGSEGGFTIPTEYGGKIHSVALESELVLPRCFVQPMTSNEKKISGTVIGDHSSNLLGGFVASWKGEATELTEADPKFRQIVFQAKKLTGLLKYSSEWKEDTPDSEKNLQNLCGAGLAWYRDKAFLKGNGAGQPLGILNADCTLIQSKEAGQQAGTLLWENLAGMFSKLHSACVKNSVWICHQSTIPQLLSLYLPVGVGGSAIPVMSESNGQFKILTRPVIFTEKTEALGSKGDCLLADLTQYVAGLRSQLRFETSNGPGFSTDEIYARLISRVAGQPLWNEALGLEGGLQVSPFVTLEARE
jgi:HK97 family phage major capsid protein